MTSKPNIIVTSALHGERAFHYVTALPYRRRDGTETQLAVWRSSCVICGAEFEITTPLCVATTQQSTAFGVVTCKAHRLTPWQTSKLRRAKADDRPGIFAA